MEEVLDIAQICHGLDTVSLRMGGGNKSRAVLDERFDDIKSGKVALIDGETAFAQLHERFEARRKGGV